MNDIKKICKNCLNFDQSSYLEKAGFCNLDPCKRVYHNDTCKKFERERMMNRIKKFWKKYEKMMLYNVIKNKKKLFFGTIAVSFMIVYSVVEIGEMLGFNVYGIYFAIAGLLLLGIAYLV